MKYKFGKHDMKKCLKRGIIAEEVWEHTKKWKSMENEMILTVRKIYTNMLEIYNVKYISWLTCGWRGERKTMNKHQHEIYFLKKVSRI